MFLCFEFAKFIFPTISIVLWVEVNNVSSELACANCCTLSNNAKATFAEITGGKSI